MSPMLFNIVVDMLAILIERAKQDGQIAGVVPHLVDGGLSILQYVGDTIPLLEHDLDKARNLKVLLSAFSKCQVSKLTSIKVNFSTLEKPTRWLQITLTCLVVHMANSRLNIWEY